MKQPINEIKRMQQLAGIKINESELNEATTDIRALVKMINNAQKSGKLLAIDGEPVTMWVASMGLLKTATTRYSINDIVDGAIELTIDGQPVELPTTTEPEVKPSMDTRTPEEIEAAKKAWMDRFGPGGGVDTFAGRYTGD